MYKEAEPKADFLKLFKKGGTAKENWFMKYYLDIKRQQEIIEEVGKKYNLGKRDIQKLSIEINLGSAPNSSKETWEEYRKEKKKTEAVERPKEQDYEKVFIEKLNRLNEEEKMFFIKKMDEKLDKLVQWCGE